MGKKERLLHGLLNQLRERQSKSMLIEAGERTHRLFLSERDFCLLGGPTPFMDGAIEFMKELGVYDNTSVAQDMKIPKDSCVTRNRQIFWSNARRVLNVVNRDADLLNYDYSFRLTGDESRSRIRTSLSGFRIRGYYGEVVGIPKGFCTLELSEAGPNGQGRLVELIDIRRRDKVPTDDMGDLRIYRSEATVGWMESLPPLVEFLTSGREREIVIHHRK